MAGALEGFGKAGGLLRRSLVEVLTGKSVDLAANNGHTMTATPDGFDPSQALVLVDAELLRLHVVLQNQVPKGTVGKLNFLPKGAKGLRRVDGTKDNPVAALVYTSRMAFGVTKVH
jgi:hypothetical protein